MAADKVLGTTSSSGVGADRKSGQNKYAGADVVFSTGRRWSARGYGTGGVNVNAFGDYRVPELQAGRKTPVILTTPEVNKEFIDSETFAVGMTSLARSLEQYTEETLVMEATVGRLAYEDTLSKLFNGSGVDTGYSQTKNFEATKGLQSFNAEVDTELKKSLDSLEPAARQKAIVDLINLRNTYRSKGAQHAQEEHNNVKEALKESERTQIANHVFLNPQDIAPKVTRNADGSVVYEESDLKRRFFSTYNAKDFSIAEKKWEGVISSVAQRMYLTGRSRVNEKGEYVLGSGLSDMRLFRDHIAIRELSGEALVELDGKIAAYENKEITTRNSHVRTQEIEFNKTQARIKNTNAASIFRNLYSGDASKILSPVKVFEMAERGEVGLSTANAYVSSFRKQQEGEKIVTDTEDYNYLRDIISETSSVNYLPEDGSINVVELVSDYGDISDTDRKSLIDKLFTAKDARIASQDKDVSDALKAAIPKITNVYEEPTREEKILIRMARDEYEAIRSDTLVNKKSFDHSKTLDYIVNKYNKAEVTTSVLPPVLGEKPRNKAEFISLLNRVDAGERNGMYTPLMAQEMRRQLSYYKQAIQRSGSGQ